MIRGIHHTAIVTKDIERLLGFYRDLLGFEEVVRYTWKKGATSSDRVVGLQDSEATLVLLKANNSFIELFEYANPVGREADPTRRACDCGITHLCFDAVDVRAEYERLKAAGIEFNTEPVHVPQIGWTTYGRDPDGNLFEIQEIEDAEGRFMLPLFRGTSA